MQARKEEGREVRRRLMARLVCVWVSVCGSIYYSLSGCWSWRVSFSCCLLIPLYCSMSGVSFCLILFLFIYLFIYFEWLE